MLQVLSIILTIFYPAAEDVEAFRQSAPAYLTVDTARDNLIAARLAAETYGVDADLVLAIAWHESRYEQKAVSLEPGHKISCGVMTPEPTYDQKTCLASTASLTSGYEAGARHLRGWIDGPESPCRFLQAGSAMQLRCGLTGYAGGNALIGACAKGPVLRYGDHGDDLCKTADVFLWRARSIEALRTHPKQARSKADS